MSLASNINQLINPHVAMNPRGKIVKQPALLTQLSEADRNGGISTTSERPIPANVNAIALAQDLLHEAKNHQYEMTSNDDGTLWQIIKSWETVEDREWQEFLGHVTLDWIDRINQIIQPTRPRRPLMQPCSACGHKYTPGDDGKRIPAVTAWVWDRQGEAIAPMEHWDVHCSNCGAEWHGKEVAKSYWRAPA